MKFINNLYYSYLTLRARLQTSSIDIFKETRNAFNNNTFLFISVIGLQFFATISNTYVYNDDLFFSTLLLSPGVQL